MKRFSTNPSDLTRRAVVSGALSASAVAQSKRKSQNLIQTENHKSGAKDWQLTNVRLVDGAALETSSRSAFTMIRSSVVEGYCSHQSIDAGQTLQIMVSADPPGRVQIELFRMGYYGGAGARLMKVLGPLAALKQPDPPVGPNRLRECKWEPWTQLKIPTDWPSGVYLGRLTRVPENANTLSWQSFVVFIVRDRREAEVLFQCSDNTWQAYNRWPDRYSMYTDPRNSWAPGVAVSFDRPYGKFPLIYENPLSVGSGEFLLWEFPLCYWLEEQGYDVTYCSNSDMTDPAQLQRARVFVSAGHDEYWDPRQYDAAMSGIKSGVSALFLSGNSVCGITPFEPGSSGRPNRIISRQGRYGGATEVETLESFKLKFAMTGPDEALLMGAGNPCMRARSQENLPCNGGGDWIATKPEHWIFTGTRMKKGERIPGLVGWEFHSYPADIPGLEVVGEGIALQKGTHPVRWTATIYPGPKNNFVFNASTIWWAQGLASPPGHILPWSHWVRPHGPDARVQRITNNLLRKALGRNLT